MQADLDFRLLVLEDMCDSCGSFHAAWGELDCRIAGILGSQFSLQPHVHGGIRHFHPYLPVDTEAGLTGGAVDIKARFSNITPAPQAAS